MLESNFIRENVDVVKAAVRAKGKDVDVDAFVALDEKRRALQKEVDDLRATQNIASKKMTAIEGENRKVLIEEMQTVKVQLKERSTQLQLVIKQWKQLLHAIPNITDPAMPIGKDESDNVVVRTWGQKPIFDFAPKEHWELGTALGVLDTEKAAEVSGARFWYLKGDLVLLQFALHQFAFATLGNENIIAEVAQKVGLTDISTKPFVPMVPPVMIREEVHHAIHRVFGDQTYGIKDENLNLVASAEHTMAPYHMNETLDVADLPKRYIGYSTAFRREAGTYGKDTKGFFRGHQFDKSEIVSFTTVENGADEQTLILGLQEYMVQALGVPYRVMQVCTGDTGAPDYQQFDIECWLSGQNAYRETHTSDYMTDYQMRGVNARYTGVDGKRKLLHTNDATAFAGRMLIAILENYQQADGSVVVPEVLRSYMSGGRSVIALVA